VRPPVVQGFTKRLLKHERGRLKYFPIDYGIFYFYFILFFDTLKVFLSPFAPERLLSSDRFREPNPDCPACSVAQTRVLVDMSRATLNDLVEDFLRLELGYGEEFVVTSETGPIYDVEETENLSKKLTELGECIPTVFYPHLIFSARHKG
jgi:hypothetical protein